MKKPRNNIAPAKANENFGSVKKESAGDTSKNTDEAVHATSEKRELNKALPRNIAEKPIRSNGITNNNRFTTINGICKEDSRKTKA